MPTQEEIDAARSPRGQWTRETLAQWGVPWPPPRGWRNRLIQESGGKPTKPSPMTGSKTSERRRREARRERPRKQVNWLADLLLAIDQDPSARKYLEFFLMSDQEIRQHTRDANVILARQQGRRFSRPPSVYREGRGPAQKRILALQSAQRRQVLDRLGLDPDFAYWEPEPPDED